MDFNYNRYIFAVPGLPNFLTSDLVTLNNNLSISHSPPLLAAGSIRNAENREYLLAQNQGARWTSFFITLESLYKNDKRSFCMYRILKDVFETLKLLFAIFMSIDSNDGIGVWDFIMLSMSSFEVRLVRTNYFLWSVYIYRKLLHFFYRIPL